VFEATSCSSSGESIVSTQPPVYVTLKIGGQSELQKCILTL